MEVLRFGDEEGLVFEAGYWKECFAVEESSKKKDRSADYSPIRILKEVN